jgi:hypothetical protein
MQFTPSMDLMHKISVSFGKQKLEARFIRFQLDEETTDHPGESS